MSQHDLTIANQGFPAFRADLNSALQALGSCQSGTSAPSPTFANQLWYDTTNNILKIRNEDNDAWISIATLDQTADSVSDITATTVNGTTVNAGALNATGNTVLGDASTDTLNVGNGGLVKDASGNTGIGTASPDARLTVSKTDVDGNIITVKGANGVNAAIGVHAGNNGGVYLQAGATRDLRLRIDTTDVLKVDKDKSVALQGAATQTGIGITFPATQSASSDANTLDDYEEGSFTPTIYGGSTAGTGTYTLRSGRYRKIGSLVFVQITIGWSAHTGTGGMSIGDLPFNTIGSPEGQSAASFGYTAALNFTAGNTPVAYFSANNNKIILQSTSSSGVMTAIAMDSVVDELIIAGTYITS